MFSDSLANMWAFSRQPGRGLLRTEVQNRLSFFFLNTFSTFFLQGGITKKVDAYANASRHRNLPKLSGGALSNRLTINERTIKTSVPKGRLY